jgi:hypothetical protein
MDSLARWTFFDPASPRFAAKAKLAPSALGQLPLRALTLREQGFPKNLHCALSESDFHGVQGSERTTRPFSAVALRAE